MFGITHLPTLNAALVVVTAGLAALFSMFDSVSTGNQLPIAAAVASAVLCATFVVAFVRSLSSSSGSPHRIEPDPAGDSSKRRWREWILVGGVVVCVAALIGEACTIARTTPLRLSSLPIPTFGVFVVATRGMWLLRRE